MRLLFLVYSLLFAITTNAQSKKTAILLNKGQIFSVKTTSSQEADMGMGMEMKNNSSSQTDFYVIEDKDTAYKVSSTLSSMKLSMEFMGQQTQYNSDLKEDKDSEIGKSIKNLNIPDTLSVNKYTAKAFSLIPLPKEDKGSDSNPFESLFESFGKSGKNLPLNDAFFIIPAGLKVGDQWMDSTVTKEEKTIKTYTLKSVTAKKATVSEIANTETNMQAEMEGGMQITIHMKVKSESEVNTDISNFQVSKRTTKSAIEGNLEIMGQSAPITGKSTTVSEFEYK